MKIKKLPIMGFIAILLISSCSKSKIDESDLVQEQSQGEVPVAVRTVRTQEFNKYEYFNSSLIGLRESSKNATISASVKDVLVKVGDVVEEGEVIITFPKNNPSISYYQALASFKSAESNYIRMKKLYSSKSVSQQDFEQVETLYNVQVANWETVSDMVEVKAPISGYITQLQVKPTDGVSSGDLLFTVSEYSTLTSIIWVPDRQIHDLRIGQSATAKWEGITLFGKVTQVDLSKNLKRKAFAVHLQFDNPKREVPSGVTSEIAVTTLQEKSSIILHKNELVSDLDGSYAYVVNGNSAERRELTIGKKQGFYYEIKGGINIGDILITEGLLNLENHSPIRVTKDETLLVTKK